MNHSRYAFFIMLAVAAAMTRIIDHPWNVAPIGAIALFAGVYFRSKYWAIAVPLLAMVISDIAIGVLRHNTDFYTFHPLVPLVYGCFAVYVMLGWGIRHSWSSMDRNQQRRAPEWGDVTASAPDPVIQFIRRLLPVTAGTLTGAILFFVVTNFGDWALFSTYPKTWLGLLECYRAGIPFFRPTLTGDFFYVAVFFGGYELLKQRLPATEKPGLLYR